MAKDNGSRLVDRVCSSSDLHTAVEGLVRAILDKDTTPAKLYTAERGLITAVERIVAEYAR